MTHEKERSALYHVNTKITYLYRDANNWKQHNCVVVKGGVTPEQVKSIVSCLHDNEYFIPSCVGMPETRFSAITEDDHPWFELTENDFLLTLEKTTLDVSIDELVARFQKAHDTNAWAAAEQTFEQAHQADGEHRIVTKEKYDALRKVLVDNGIDADEVDVVAQAVCYVLCDEETEQFAATEKG